MAMVAIHTLAPKWWFGGQS